MLNTTATALVTSSGQLAKIFPRFIHFILSSYFLLIVIGVLGLGSWDGFRGFWGQGVQLMMFGACGAGPSELFWGWGSLFIGHFKLINLICINPLMVKNLDNIIEFLITGMHNLLPKLNHFIQQIHLGKLILIKR